MQPGHPACVGPPCLRERDREVRLVGQYLVGALRDAPGFQEGHRRALRQQVGQRCGALHQPGPPRLHSLEQVAGLQAVPLTAAPRLLSDQLSGPAAHGRIGTHLAGRVQIRALEGRIGPLVADGERGEPIHLVAPEVDTHRGGRSGRIHVHYRASHGHLTGVLDLVLTSISEGNQLLDQVNLVQFVAENHAERLGHPGGVHALGQRPRGDDHHRGRALRVGQAMQHAAPATHRGDGRADPLEGQRLPGGQLLHVVPAQVTTQVGAKGLRLRASGRDHQQGPAARRGAQTRHSHGATRLRHCERRCAASEQPRQRGVLRQHGHEPSQAGFCHRRCHSDPVEAVHGLVQAVHHEALHRVGGPAHHRRQLGALVGSGTLQHV